MNISQLIHLFLFSSPSLPASIYHISNNHKPHGSASTFYFGGGNSLHIHHLWLRQAKTRISQNKWQMFSLGESSIKGLWSLETMWIVFTVWDILADKTNMTCPYQIVASYTTTSGETKTSLLLTSGWWVFFCSCEYEIVHRLRTE